MNQPRAGTVTRSSVSLIAGLIRISGTDMNQPRAGIVTHSSPPRPSLHMPDSEWPHARLAMAGG
jgi:hypothetical protein